MEIYELKKDYNGYYEPVIEDEQLMSLIEDNWGKKMKHLWVEKEIKWFQDEESSKIADIPLLLGTIPLCNEKVYTILLENNIKGIEFLPLLIEDKRFYIINPTPPIQGVLNKNRSKIRYSSDKKIEWIDKYVFYPIELDRYIFKIVEMYTSIFATNYFVDLVNKYNITGITFNKCSIKSKTFLEQILNK